MLSSAASPLCLRTKRFRIRPLLGRASPPGSTARASLAARLASDQRPSAAAPPHVQPTFGLPARARATPRGAPLLLPIVRSQPHHRHGLVPTTYNQRRQWLPATPHRRRPRGAAPEARPSAFCSSVKPRNRAAGVAMAAVEAVPPLGKYPAKEHARKVAGLVVERGGDAKGVVYLEGQKTRMFEDCDQAAGFRQRRPFMYMTGCEVPDCYCTYDMAADKLTLFIPPIDPDDVVWSGLPLTVEEAVEKYDIDNARLSTEVNAYLTSSDHPQSTVYALPDRVSDDVTFLSFAKTDFDLLAGAITTARITKDAYEISLIRYANAATAAGHAAVMRGAATAANEADLEAAFVKECIARQCKKLAYEAIVAGGPHAATLHYVRNDAPLAGKQLVLVDAGAEFGCYAADVTRTMPVSRQGFSAEAWAVYDVVERMQAECVARTLPGARWEAVHEHAHRVAIEGLLALGILRGGSVADILAARTSAAFFPHGLGHYLGMDTHDVGGEADYADPDPMFRYLRVRRELEPGAVITVEPGVYFCRFIVEPYLRDEKHKKYIDEAVLERFWDVGGVRIEDNILITESGNENLTTVPKGAEEVSNIVKGNA